MTGRFGVMLIREGQYALALLAGPASIQDLRINRQLAVTGDVIAGALPLLLVDFVLLSAGVRPQGLSVTQVVEP